MPVGRETKGNAGGMWVSRHPVVFVDAGGKRKKTRAVCRLHTASLSLSSPQEIPPTTGGINEIEQGGV